VIFLLMNLENCGEEKFFFFFTLNLVEQTRRRNKDVCLIQNNVGK